MTKSNQICVFVGSLLASVFLTPLSVAQSPNTSTKSKATATATAPAKPLAKSVVKPTTKATQASASDKPVVNTVFAYPAALGAVACDDNVSVSINKDIKRSDGFDVQLGKAHYPTTRVATDSGAIRLENKESGIVWLQMSNKSMLFNEKAGKRLANNCRNDLQIAAEKEMAASTAPTILDAPATKTP
jgi:hypothetical protein